jgi:hypothetical protein
VKRAYDSNAGEVRRYALNGARAELARLLELFPELRQEIAGGPEQKIDVAEAMRHNARVLRHWRRTAAPAAKPAAGNGHAAGGPQTGFRDAVRQALTATPSSIAEITARVEATGFKYTASTPIGNRVAQELAGLRQYGEAKKTANGWRVAKGAPAK